MRARPMIVGVALVALAGTGCSGGPAQGGPRTPTALASTAAQPGKQPGTPRELATGLAVPWAVAFLPDGDALVTERDSARLVRVTPSGQVSVVGKVPGVASSEGEGEGGLLGVAVSPSFRAGGYVYLYFSARSDNRIMRFRYDKALGRLEPLVTGIPRGRIHNGGRLAFGPDKMLYATTGETGSGGLAQDKDSLGGKILRMTPDGKPAPGNPFGTLVWTYGHRNVQGIAWDDAGRMYASEFGQDHFDEVNRIEKGKNYGWPDVEGFAGSGDKRFTDPLLTWTTAEASPSAAAFADGSLWVAALRGQRLWRVPLGRDGSAGKPEAYFEGRYGRLRAVARAPDGSLWVTTSNKDGRGSPRKGDDKILIIPLN